MTSLIVGVDLSTRRIDTAAIPFDPGVSHPVIFWHEKVEGNAGNPAERARNAGAALRRGIRYLDKRDDVVSVVIERPVGMGAQSLLPILGSLTASINPLTTVTWLRPQEWRTILGIKRAAGQNWKQAAQAWTRRHASGHAWILDEHEADAYCLAAAWRLEQWRSAA